MSTDRLQRSTKAVLLGGVLIAMSQSLVGCTPEGLQVFAGDQKPGDLPAAAVHDLLPGVDAESFRSLGVLDSVEYFAAVRPGADDPWCLIAVDDAAPLAVCANHFPITMHRPGGSVSLYNEAPATGGPWIKEGTSFWSSRAG